MKALTDPKFKTELVCPVKLKEALGPILVAISGGSDSDIVMDLIERHKGDADVRYVWYDTGLEYEATKQHLAYLCNRYDVNIERFPAKTPIPLSCKRKGVPFLSKRVSDEIQRLQRHGFRWEDRSFDELYKEYPSCKQALKWWCNQWPPTKSGKQSSQNIGRNAYLKEFLIEDPPNFEISPFCCDDAKKRPAKCAVKKYGATLNVTGERRSEGGVRATAKVSCFSPATDSRIARYRPLYFFSDADKQLYEKEHGIIHSDCYTVWGLKRTGCAACPFGSKFEDELRTIKQYEPQLYKAAQSVFGKSYEYTRKYREFKAKMKAKRKPTQAGEEERA